MAAVDEFLAELQVLSAMRTPIRFRLKTEFSRVFLSGYVTAVSGNTVEFESEARDSPLFRVRVAYAGVLSLEEKGFDIAVLEEFGKLFDELDPKERGKLWAKRFERAWIIHFVSGALCVVEKLVA